MTHVSVTPTVPSCIAVYSWRSTTLRAAHDDVIRWKHFPRYWPFVRGNQQSLVNSPHKSQWRGALMFSLICARINGWVNNREAGSKDNVVLRLVNELDISIFARYIHPNIIISMFSMQRFQSVSKPDGQKRCTMPIINWSYTSYLVEKADGACFTRDVVVSKAHDGVIKWKHFPRYWPFVRGIHRAPQILTSILTRGS